MVPIQKYFEAHELIGMILGASLSIQDDSTKLYILEAAEGLEDFLDECTRDMLVELACS